LGNFTPIPAKGAPRMTNSKNPAKSDESHFVASERCAPPPASGPDETIGADSSVRVLNYFWAPDYFS
jgi:hypothetical protein